MDYEYWLQMAEDDLSRCDVGEVKLHCAVGLPGVEQLNIPAYKHRLDMWATLIARATEYHLSQSRGIENGAESEAQFRMLVFVTILQRNPGVRYNPACMSGPYDAREARTLFVHGLIDGGGGTCASLPVLYLALGRRLGYPLMLVETKEHLFVRWYESGGEAFNIECTMRGFAARSDDYYRTWPRAINDDEIESCGYLRSFSARQELACFLQQRGCCFFDNLRIPESIDAHACAVRLEPTNRNHRGHCAVAIMAQRILHGVRHEALIDLCRLPPLELRRMLCWHSILTRDARDVWAVERAITALDRVLTLHRQSLPDVGLDGEVSTIRSTNELSTSSTFA